MGAISNSWNRVRAGAQGGAQSPRQWPGALSWGLAGAAAAVPLVMAAARDPLHAGWVTMALLGFGVLTWVVLEQPAWGACLLILLVYWNVSDVLALNFNFSWLLRLAIAGAVGAWALNHLLRPGRRLRWPLVAPLAAWGAAQALAAVGAADRGVAAAQLGEYAKALVVFYLVVNMLDTPRVWRWGVNAVLLAASLMSLPVIYQGLTGSRSTFAGFGTMIYASVVNGKFSWRPGGTLGDPNFLAMVLVAALPLAALQALEPRAGVRRWLALAALALGALGALFTYSRGGFLGMLLLAIVLLLRHRRRRLVALALVVVAAGAVAVAPHTLWARVATLFQNSITQPGQQMTDPSFRDRRHEMLAGALMFLDHPLVGVGPGNFEDQYLKYSARAGLSGETTVRDPHSLYTQIAAETGLVGLAAFVWLVVAAFALMERGRRRARGAGAQNFAGLITALELGVGLYLVMSTFLHDAYFRHFMLLVALGATGAALALTAGGRRRAAAGALPALR
ncbi:MAG: O-antigen ligase family protein [Terriglobales bacterium]